MKKFLILPAALLAISVACFAGCSANGNADKENSQRPQNLVQQEQECPDDNCNKDGRSTQSPTIPDDSKAPEVPDFDEPPEKHLPDFREPHKRHRPTPIPRPAPTRPR